MPYTLHEHTADIRLKVLAGSFAGLFSESMHAMNAVSCPVYLPKTVEHSVAVDSQDRLSLLVDFLNELLYLGQVHHEAYDELRITAINDTRFEGIVKGQQITGMGEEIKAVTWHEASLQERADGTWMVHFVLDI